MPRARISTTALHRQKDSAKGKKTNEKKTKRGDGDHDVVGPGKPRRRSLLLQLLAGRSPIGVEVRGPFRRARDAVKADCRGAGACCGKLAILRFVFHLFLFLSLSFSLVERQHRASSSRASASLDLCCPRDLCARARERKKLRGIWLNFGSRGQNRGEKRTEIRTSAGALRCRIVASR